MTAVIVEVDVKRILAISTFCFFGLSFSVNGADETAPATREFTPEEIAIREKYDKMSYKLELEFPLCQEVMNRKKEETIELLRSHLGNDATMLALFDELQHNYPSMAMGAKLAPNLVIGKGQTADTAQVPVYFAGTTQIRRLISNEVKSSDETVGIDKIQKGEFVLSTTEHLESDPRYRKVCWGRVFNVFAGTVKAGDEMALVLYRGPENTKESLRATPQTCVYARPDLANGAWVSRCVAETDLEPSTGLFTLKTSDKVTRDSRFSEILLDAAGEEEPVFNLHIEWTGSYFVGKKGSEILIRN